MSLNLETVVEELRDYFYDKNNEDVQVKLDENEINVYLDLPDTRNYDAHIDTIERFFSKSKYDVEDFDFDGDYEGTITLTYEGE